MLKRLFLEAWMSLKDPNAGNDHTNLSQKSTSAQRALKL